MRLSKGFFIMIFAHESGLMLKEEKVIERKVFFHIFDNIVCAFINVDSLLENLYFIFS